jgi:hypothetical protein
MNPGPRGARGARGPEVRASRARPSTRTTAAAFMSVESRAWRTSSTCTPARTVVSARAWATWGHPHEPVQLLARDLLPPQDPQAHVVQGAHQHVRVVDGLQHDLAQRPGTVGVLVLHQLGDRRAVVALLEGLRCGAAVEAAPQAAHLHEAPARTTAPGVGHRTAARRGDAGLSRTAA